MSATSSERRVIRALKQKVDEYPQLRLGQLIENAVADHCAKLKMKGIPTFYVSNDFLEQALLRYAP